MPPIRGLISCLFDPHARIAAPNSRLVTPAALISAIFGRGSTANAAATRAGQWSEKCREIIALAFSPGSTPGISKRSLWRLRSSRFCESATRSLRGQMRRVRAPQEVLCRVEAVMQVCEVSAGSMVTTRPPRCCVLQESLLTKLFQPWNDQQGRARFLTGLTTGARARESR
jgi:hypothetical protein